MIFLILEMWDVLWNKCFDAYCPFIPIDIYEPFNFYGWASYNFDYFYVLNVIMIYLVYS